VKTITLLTLSLILAAVAPVQAADLNVPAEPTTIPSLPSASQGTLSLSLVSAYEIALQRNLDLQVGRYDIVAAAESIVEQAGIFDPNLTLGVSGNFTKSPASSALEGAAVSESRATNFGLGFDSLLPTGTTLNLDVGMRRAETNNNLYFLNPSWNTDLTAGITQPLLKDFGTLVNRAGILVATNSRDQITEGFNIQVIQTLLEVEQAYWDLVAAREQIDVAVESLELAQRLLSETNERVDVGTSAPIDLVQSEAGVASRLQDLIVARNAADNAEDTLKAVLGFDAPNEWELRIDVTDDYRTQFFEADLKESIETALERRPAIHRQQLVIDRTDLNVKLARNSVMPRLDLNATYGYGGVGGQLIDPSTGEVIDDGGPSDAWRQLGDRDFPHWTLGAQFAVPIGNNQAKARLAQRRFEHEQSQVQLDLLEQQVIRDVRLTVRALSDGAASVEAAVASRDLAARNLEAEQTKFANGLSTNYQVLQIQEDLAIARLTELRSRITYRKAIASYLASVGKLLETRSITVQAANDPDVPHDYWKDVQWLQVSDLKSSAQKVTVPPPPIPEPGQGE